MEKLSRKEIVDKIAEIALELNDVRNVLLRADKSNMGQMDAFFMGFLVGDALRSIHDLQRIAGLIPE